MKIFILLCYISALATMAFSITYYRLSSVDEFSDKQVMVRCMDFRHDELFVYNESNLRQRFLTGRKVVTVTDTRGKVRIMDFGSGHLKCEEVLQ